MQQIKRVLAYLPNSGTQLPPLLPAQDPSYRLAPELRSIVPRRRERGYNMRKIVKTVLDQDSWFEIGAKYGLTTIAGLGRLAGVPVRVIASDCEGKIYVTGSFPRKEIY